MEHSFQAEGFGVRLRPVRMEDAAFIVWLRNLEHAKAHGIYDVLGTSAEHGRFIIRPEVPAAIPCLMIGFDLAFGRMGLTELRGTVVATNHTVISLNRKLGCRQIKVEPGGRVIGSKAVDMVHFVLSPDDWSKAGERLVPLARLAEKQVREWELTQFRGRDAR